MKRTVLARGREWESFRPSCRLKLPVRISFACLIVWAVCLFAPVDGWGALAPGPDTYGYTVAPSTSFPFTNINATGTRVLNFDDDTAATANLGFSFSFYGSNYTTVSFNPNGLISFGGPSTDYSNVNLTVSAPSNNLPVLAVLWCDYETESPGADAVYYTTIGTPGNRQFIVQWNQVMLVLGPGVDTITFEARLFEQSNRILFSYLDVVVADAPGYSRGAYATVGMRDVDGQLNGRNLLWSHNQAVITNGMHLLFAPSNHPPVAVNDVATTTERTPVSINVLANDSDPDGNALTITSILPGSYGTVVINGGTNVTYSPTNIFFPSDSFSYMVSDGQGGSATGTVNVTIIAVNDPPIATNDVYQMDEDTLLVVPASGVLGNDGDPEGDTLRAVVVSTVQHGILTFRSDGSFSYLPDTNFNGVDRFVYRASDGMLLSSNATVTIQVRPVNDPPVALGGSFTTVEDTPVIITLRGTDLDGDPLSYSIVQPPAHGDLRGLPPNLIYQPDTNFAGNDSLLYAASDGQGGSGTNAVFITITPVNDGPPVAGEDHADTYQDTPLALLGSTLLANDTDVDPEEFLTITNVCKMTAIGGSVTWTNETIFYYPLTNFIGLDSFSYTLSDGNGGSATGLVQVTVWSRLRIFSITRGSGGTVWLEGCGIPRRTNRVEASFDFVTWSVLGSAREDPAGTFEFDDREATGLPARFYRLREE